MSGPDNKPDDRLLEDFLAGRSDLSRAYAKTEALSSPTTLDAEILELARQPPIARSARWKRLQMPVALAATVVMGLSVMLNIQRDPEAYRAASAPVVMSEPVSVAEQAPAALALTPTAAPASKMDAHKRRLESVVTTPAVAQESARVEAPVEESSSGVADSFASSVDEETIEQPMLDASNHAAARAPTMMRERRSAEADYRPQMNVQKMAPPPAAVSAMAPPEFEAAEQWLARIRALRDAGKNEEARKLWAEYRQVYPTEPIPTDLQGYEPAKPLEK